MGEAAAAGLAEPTLLHCISVAEPTWLQRVAIVRCRAPLSDLRCQVHATHSRAEASGTAHAAWRHCSASSGHAHALLVAHFEQVCPGGRSG